MNTDTENYDQNPSTFYTLDELAHRETVPELWSDKRSPRKTGEIYVCHDYLRLYDREFTPIRQEHVRLLEVGLNVGASVKLWQDYFKHGLIFGVDICKFEPKVNIPAPDRFVFRQADQSDVDFWKEFREEFPEKFDIIIDDGSHASGPIITTFSAMWEHVRPGGCYIIEDLGEVRNPDSHTKGFPDQLDWSVGLLANVLLGHGDIDEVHVSKELLIIRKKS